MVLETKINAKIVAGIDKQSFNNTEKTARDTGKKLNNELKTKLELDVAKFQLNLDKARKNLREAKKEGDKNATLEAQMKVNKLQRDTTESKRLLNNYVNTGEKSLSRLQTKFNQIGTGFVNTFKSMVGPLAIVGLFTTAIRGLFNEFKKSAEVSREFENSMANVATLIDTNVESIGDMSNELFGIAKRVPVSLGELTSALYDVRSAGISAENAMNVLESGAILSTAGLGTTKEAVNILTSAINTYGEDTLTANEASTSFFLAVKNGKTTISELAQGFGSTAGLAKSLGVDFNDLLASVTALTTSGLSASEAYTQVNGILTAVAKGGKQASDMAEKLKFDFSATALETKGLKGFIDDLNVSLKENGLEGGEATEALAKLFGRKEALVGVLSLLNPRAALYNSILEEMNTQIAESNKLLDAFDKVNKTVDSRLEKLNSELTIERIKLGQTTSKRQGLGIYLKIEFLKTLNSLGNTMGAIGDIFVGTWKIIYESAKDALTGVGDLIKNFLKTGEIDFSKAFNFEGAKAEIDSLFKNVKNRFDGSTQDTAEAVKARNDLIEDLNSDLEDDLEDLIDKYGGSSDEIKDGTDEATDAIEEQEKAMKDYTDSVDDFTKDLTSFYDGLQDSIDDTIKKQEDLKQGIEDVDKDIASRVVEIDAKIASGDLEPEEIQKLQQERDIAFAGLSKEEIKELKERIKEIKDYEQLTEIEKLQLKKENLQNELQIEIDKEIELNNRKKVIADNFEDYLKSKATTETQIAESLRQKWLAVAAARAKAGAGGETIPGRATGGPVGAGSPYIVGERGPELFIPENSGKIIPNNQLTNNININASVNNDIELDRLANELARKIQLSRKGVF